jgi:hypothetical protein
MPGRQRAKHGLREPLEHLQQAISCKSGQHSALFPSDDCFGTDSKQSLKLLLSQAMPEPQGANALGRNDALLAANYLSCPLKSGAELRTALKLFATLRANKDLRFDGRRPPPDRNRMSTL